MSPCHYHTSFHKNILYSTSICSQREEHPITDRIYTLLNTISSRLALAARAAASALSMSSRTSAGAAWRSAWTSAVAPLRPRQATNEGSAAKSRRHSSQLGAAIDHHRVHIGYSRL